MRSIRRSLTIYHLILLAITLGVMWVVIDQVAAHALEAREGAGAELIQAQYDARVRDERARADQALLQQAKELANVMQSHYWTQFSMEMAKYRAAVGTVQLALGPTPFAVNPLAQLAWSATGNNPGTQDKPNPVSASLFRNHFANLPLPDEIIEKIDEDNRGGDLFQINTLAGREWHSRSLYGRSLPFDHKQIDSKTPETKPAEPGKPHETANVIDWQISDTTLNQGNQAVRRVLMKVPMVMSAPPPPGPRSGGRPVGREGRPGPPPGSPGGPGVLFGPPPPRSMLGAWAAWTLAGFGSPAPVGLPPQQPTPPPTPNLDSLPRLYIQCARPQATIEALLSQFASERDADLARLVAEIREARTTLRFQIATIGLIAFLAIAIGGPLIVGTGLRPLGKLSDAVSRVSEKDFKLPHDGQGLSEELAPIHSRLTQTLDLLQRAFAREKQSVADISHELRTPIAALLATIDVALRKPRTPEHYRSTLEECRLISRQLSQLVERIMTLASLDAGNDHMQVARTDGAELATGCGAVIRPLAAANGIVVDVQVEPVLELDTDAGKLREVLMNLLHNAVEYNRPNGTIELTARRDNGSVVFEVRDTGIGMTPEVKEKVFERFSRPDPPRHSTGVHAGLGLAIVKEYVARLNGTISVESEAGAGSTFRVSLPAESQAEAAPRARPAGAPIGA